MIYNHIGVLIILLLASIADIKYKIIPDALLVAGLLAGIVLFAFNPRTSLITLLINLAVIAAILFAIYFASRKAIGLGDIKLIILLGLYINLYEVAAVSFVAVMLSGLFSLLLLLFKTVKRDSEIPFAPFLLAGGIIAFYF